MSFIFLVSSGTEQNQTQNTPTSPRPQRKRQLTCMPNLISREEFTFEYVEHLFDNTGPFTIVRPLITPESQNETLFVSYRDALTFFRLIDNTQMDVISRVVLEDESFFGTNYKVIKLTTARYNKLKYVFMILLYDMRYHLMSDHTHTIKGSMNFWKKVPLLQDIEVRTVNIETRYNRRYETQSDSLIWGLDELYLIGNDLNTPLIDLMRTRGKINDDLYAFILTHQKNIKNRRDTRLTARAI